MGQFESKTTTCLDQVVMDFALACFHTIGAPMGPLRMWQQTFMGVSPFTQKLLLIDLQDTIFVNASNFPSLATISLQSLIMRALEHLMLREINVTP